MPKKMPELKIIDQRDKSNITLTSLIEPFGEPANVSDILSDSAVKNSLNLDSSTLNLSNPVSANPDPSHSSTTNSGINNSLLEPEVVSPLEFSLGELHGYSLPSLSEANLIQIVRSPNPAIRLSALRMGFNDLDLETYFQAVQRLYQLDLLETYNNPDDKAAIARITLAFRDDLSNGVTLASGISSVNAFMFGVQHRGVMHVYHHQEFSETDKSLQGTDLFFEKLLVGRRLPGEDDRQVSRYETAVARVYHDLLNNLFGHGFAFAGRIFQEIYGSVMDPESGSASLVGVYPSVRLLFKLNTREEPIRIHVDNNASEILISSGYHPPNSNADGISNSINSTANAISNSNVGDVRYCARKVREGE